MLDLAAIYNIFDADEPLPADDNIRYVDLSSVRGESKITRKLLQRIVNAGNRPSQHLLMGHTKCGKTTELNRTVRALNEAGYAVVFFDVAETATHTFEYTTVLLLLAGQIVDQLSKLRPDALHVKGASAKKLADFLLDREITVGRDISTEAKGNIDAELAPGFLVSLLGKFGIGLELRGGFEKSREMTVKIEADTRAFLTTVQELVQDACEKVANEGYRGLVVVCDGCDKLTLAATDENGKSRDLQLSMFVDHAPDLRCLPCHVIYTVPISIQANLGDNWEQTPEFVPAIPVTQLPDVDDQYPKAGRAALREVVRRRLDCLKIPLEALFPDAGLLDNLIYASGGHISDLLMMVRDAVLEAQTNDLASLTDGCIKRAIRNRAHEYTRLIEAKYLETLVAIDQYKTAQSSSDSYRELIFKRLALEYACGIDARVDLHPLVAASDAFKRFRRPAPE